MPSIAPASTLAALYFEEITDEDEGRSNARLTSGPQLKQLTCKPSIQPGLGGGGQSSLALINDHLYLFGGCSSRNGSCSSALTSFDIASSSSVELSIDQSSAPSARHGHSIISHGAKLIVFGGQGGPSAPSSTSPSVSFNDLHVYNTQTNVWFCLDRGSAEDESAEEYYGQTIRPMPRNSHSVVVSDGHMILFGGANAEVGPMNDMWSLDLLQLDEIGDDSCKAGVHKLRWERMEGAHDDAKDKTGDDGATPWPEAREMHSACIVPLNGHLDEGKDHMGILLMGGRKADGTACHDMWLFDIRTQSWRQLIGATQPRCSHTSVYLPNENVVIFFGGWDGAGTIIGDILCFDLTSESWIELDSAAIHGDRIPERFAHAACEDGTGNGLYIVGGVNAENDLQDLVHISMARK